MKKLLAVLSIVGAMTSCGAKNTSESAVEASAARSKIVQLSPADSSKVFGVLKSMGVVDAQGRVGSNELQVTALRCSKLKLSILPVNPPNAPECTFTTPTAAGGSKLVQKSGEGAGTLIEILGRNKASVNGGINGIAVAAKSLKCSMAVVMNPKPSCVLELL